MSIINKENVDFEGSLSLGKAVDLDMQEISFLKAIFTRGMAAGWYSESLPEWSYIGGGGEGNDDLFLPVAKA